MSRGSNARVAIIVSTTTAPKATAAGPTLIVARPRSCTSVLRIAATKMSVIDQRPIRSTMR